MTAHGCPTSYRTRQSEGLKPTHPLRTLRPTRAARHIPSWARVAPSAPGSVEVGTSTRKGLSQQDEGKWTVRQIFSNVPESCYPGQEIWERVIVGEQW